MLPVIHSSRIRVLLLFLLLISSIILLTSCGFVGKSTRNTANPSAPSNTGQSSERPPEEPSTSGERPGSDVSVTEVTPGTKRAGRSHHSVRPGDGLTVELSQGEIGSGKIALTFDAGASSKPTPELLKVLADNGVKATFFLTGKWVEENPELTREIIAEGHEIGNHTYSHPDLRRLTDDEIREQLSKTEEIVQSVAGVSTKPYFRPPYGGRDQRVISVASEDGYQCVYWSLDSLDAFKQGITTSEIEQRVTEKASDGAIILMHCGSWPTVKALPDIISSLRGKGYDLVRVSDLAKE